LTGVAGLLLAAGAGIRFGGPKALVEVDGGTLLDRGVALLWNGGCSSVHVVLGAGFDVVAPHVRHAEAVHASDWSDGLGASLRAALTALSGADARACVIALVDQPLVGAAAVRRLIDVPGDPAAVVATYAGATGHPVLLSRRVWADVAALAQGDIGARPWLDAHRDEVMAVACDDTGSPRDIDTPEDLAAVLALP
jgi:CTP:molybdopterin cytidylyltransferase MocA